MLTTIYQMADGIVIDWMQNQKVAVDDLSRIALRSSIAQGLNVATAEKDREIEELKRRLAAVSAAAKEVLQGSDRA